MTTHGWSWKLGLASALVVNGAILASGDCVFAQSQITPDTTLGANERSLVRPNVEINGLPSEQIDGGAQRGANLFHSFQQFNVSEGRGAYFTNPTGIENILSRVTGNNSSEILGTLGVTGGDANLFLMNPNGIFFGPNASLDVNGSFMATTANGIQFGNQGSFSASAPNPPSVLVVNPSTLLFNQIAAQPINSIENRASLSVPNSKSLLLVGGDVSLEGGRVETAGGRIELGSVAGVGEVSLRQTGDRWELGYDSITAFGNVGLEDGAFVDAIDEDGGDIQIQGAQLEMTQSSSIFADTSGAGDGGEVLVKTTEGIALRDGSLLVAISGSGNGGNLTIDTGRLTVQGGARVLAITLGTGNGGNLKVTADVVEVIGISADSQVSSGLFASTAGDGDADTMDDSAGDLTIDTGQLLVRDGAQISAGTFGTGNGGNLKVTADVVEVIGISANSQFPSGLFTRTEGDSDADTIDGNAGDLTIDTGRLLMRGDGAEISAGTFGTGNGGTLNVTAGQLLLRDGAQISAGTFGTGNGGNLKVTADVVELIGTSADGQLSSGLFAQTDGDDDPNTKDGNAGNLTIDTGRLTIQNGARASASTLGTGNGGSLNITADLVEVIGISANSQFPSGLFASTEGDGDAGNLTIDTEQLTIQNGARASASTFGTGNGGNLKVTNADLVEVINTSKDGQFLSKLSAQTEGNGAAGDLKIGTRQLTVRDRAEVTVSSERAGDAGNLEVVADSIGLDNQATLNANTTAGQGNIILDSQDIVLRRGSNITTNATGTATGGNIEINTDVLAALENSDISADAQAAFGGQVQIKAQGIIGTEFREQPTPESDITASSALGPEFSGIVEINTPDVELQGSLNQLSANFISPEQVVTGSCLARRNTEQGSFTVTGTGGLPRSPYEAISGRYAVTGVQPIQENGLASKPAQVVKNAAWKLGDPIQEAQGMVVTADGRTIVGTAPQLVALAKAQNLVCHSN